MWRLLIVTTLLAPACVDGDGDVLYVRIAATQPDDPANGRLLSVFAQLGDRGAAGALRLQVIGGMLRGADVTAPSSSLCAAVAAHTLVEVPIAVLPDADEAVLQAELLDAGDSCTGAARTRIVVPVQRVSGPTEAP